MERLTKRYIYEGKNYISVDSKKSRMSCSNFCTNCGKADCEDIRKALFKLEEYENLEEQGKLLKLPCAVGDTIYHLCTCIIGKPEIIEMKVGCVEPCGAIRNHKGVCEVWNVYAETDYTKAYFKFFDFGKTVFNAREEAEAALKKLQMSDEPAREMDEMIQDSMKKIGEICINTNESEKCIALKMALSALRKQMKEKPILDTIYHQQYYCPNCEDFLTRKNGEKPHHCICGQAIDWLDN